MDPREQIAQLEKRISELEKQLAGFTTTPDLNPDIVRALTLALQNSILAVSSDTVTDYDRSVNESGTFSYTVAKVYDGLFEVNGKIVGYYDPI